MSEPAATRPEACCPPGAFGDPRAEAIGRHFDDRIVDWEPVAPAATDLMWGWVEEAGLATASFLDLGCGGGPLLLRALDAGAARATGVDLSADSIEVARDRLAEAGRMDQVDLMTGDAAAADLETHDVVVLDKVICCYPNAALLVDHSSAAAGRIYAFAIPESRGLWGLVNRGWWLWDAIVTVISRTGVIIKVHSVAAIRQRLAVNGFRLRHEGRSGVWYVGVFERA